VTCYSKTDYRFRISRFDLIKKTISGHRFFQKVKICCTVLFKNMLSEMKSIIFLYCTNTIVDHNLIQGKEWHFIVIALLEKKTFYR